MPGKRPRQIKRTTSMSQLGGASSFAMGTSRFSQTVPGNFCGEAGPPQRGLSAPVKPDFFETMEVCSGPGNAAAPGALMEEDYSSMAMDDGVEESLYASHTVQPVAFQAADLGAQNRSLHSGHLSPLPSPLLLSPKKVMGYPPGSVYRAHEAGRSVQTGHFLDACNRCSKRLGHGRDVFIYRGDRAFCSVECRHAQIVADEMREDCRMAAVKEGIASNTPARNPPTSNKQVGTATAA